MREYWQRIRRLFGPKDPEEEDTPPGFVDIHAHIIPAIDDGPSKIEDVLKMLRRSYDSGTREVVATPHMFLELFGNTDPALVVQAFEETRERLVESAGPPNSSFLEEMTFYPGAENFLCPEFFSALENEAVLALNHSRYILVESPPNLSIIHLRHTIQRILKSSYKPIIAHPERYRAFQEKPEDMSEFVDQGCLSQVNAGSLLGLYGRQGKKTSWALLQKGLVHAIASDNHGSATRSHDLGTVYTALKGRFTETELDRWLRANPRSIVRDLPIEAG